jgi:hypothetical protein
VDCQTTTPVTVQIEKLIRDERLRFRVPHSHVGPDAEEHTIDRYREAFADYEGWGLFPPITVVELTQAHEFDAIQTERDQRIGVKPKKLKYAKGAKVLVGGFTRCMAATLAGVLDCPANVVLGTWDDAVEMAWIENSRHDGRARTKQELRDVIRSIEAVFPDLSEHEVARKAGCNRSAVWRARQAEKEASEAPIDTDDPGKSMKGGKISSTQSAEVERDLWGRPIASAKIREQFACVPVVLDKKKRISSLMAEIAKLKQGPDGTAKCHEPGMVNVDVPKLFATVTEALDEMTDVVPWIVCPECDGDNPLCERCCGRGWITKLHAEDLPPNLEKKARKWMSDRSKD